MVVVRGCDSRGGEGFGGGDVGDSSGVVAWDGDGGDKGEGGGCGVVKVAVVWRGGGEGARRRVGGWIE
ncbi:hypothetical protein Tco_1021345 [Tanacetum coccineum]